jgi:hypothetical protein
MYSTRGDLCLVEEVKVEGSLNGLCTTLQLDGASGGKVISPCRFTG